MTLDSLLKMSSVSVLVLIVYHSFLELWPFFPGVRVGRGLAISYVPPNSYVIVHCNYTFKSREYRVVYHDSPFFRAQNDADLRVNNQEKAE
jgi:hypothetical protein